MVIAWQIKGAGRDLFGGSKQVLVAQDGAN